MGDFNFIGGSSTTRSRVFDAQETINLYPEQSGSGTSKNIAMLIGTPGLALWKLLEGGGIRGMLRFSPTLAIVVAGANVYRVTSLGVATLLGTTFPRTTPVSMDSNGVQVMLVTGPEGYVIDPVLGTFSQITDPAFRGADRVVFVDGYFAFNAPGTDEYQITALNSTSLDALDIGTAEGSPDALVTVATNSRDLWLLGETSTELAQNTGNIDFPFERIQGVFIEHGCAAKYSVAKAMDPTGASRLFWLAADERGQGIVVASGGYQVGRISTHAVEYSLGRLARIDDAIGFTYQQEGHTFYVLTLPTGNVTWVYDLGTQLWHKRAWRSPLTGNLNRHRANCVMAFAGQILVGDFELPRVYRWSLDVFDDAGDPLPAIRQAPHVAREDGRWLIYDRFWLDMETGVGLVSGQGSDPMVLLEWSDDGGATFTGQRLLPAGKLGERKRRAIARRLGKSRDRVFRVTITDPIPRYLVNADVETRRATA